MPQPDSAPFIPYCNLELFLQNCGKTRLHGQEMETLLRLWEEWAGELHIRQVGEGRQAFLAVWLNETVEQAVDAAWAASPSEGFLSHTLALTLCMCAVQELVPETENMRCAPLPHPSRELAAALATAGLPCGTEKGLVLGRRYAVVTASPFRGGCESCSLHENCPRATGGPRNVVLPGHERV